MRKTLRERLEEEGRWEEVSYIKGDTSFNNKMRKINNSINEKKIKIQNDKIDFTNNSNNINVNNDVWNNVQNRANTILSNSNKINIDSLQKVNANNNRLDNTNNIFSNIKSNNIKPIDNNVKETFGSKIRNFKEDIKDKVGYQFKNLGSGVVNGVTGIAEAPILDIANEMKKGEDKSTAETMIETLKSVFSPQSNITENLKNVSEVSKENQEILKNKDLSIGEKIIQVAINTTSGAKQTVLNQIPGVSTIKNLSQTIGSILPQADEKILESTKIISKPAEKINEHLQEEAKKHSNTENFIGGAMQSVGNMLPSIATSVVTGDPTAGLLAMEESVKGQSTIEAMKLGKDLDEAIKIGDTKGMIELGTEMLSGGINFFGKGALDDILDSGLKKITNEVNRFLATQFKNSIGEVGEEVISDILNTYIDKYTVDSDSTYGIKDFGKTAGQTVLTTFVLNLLTGGLYNDIRTGKNRSNLKIETNNSNLNDIEKQNIVKKINEGEITNQEQLQNIISTQNEQTTIDNEQVLNNNQQVIPEDSKMTQNQMSEQIESNVQNEGKIEYNNAKNDEKSFSGYTEKEINNLKSNKIRIANSEQDITNFASTATKLPGNIKMYVAKVKNNVSDFIKNKFNIDLGEYNISLSTDSIRHVMKEHSNVIKEKNRGQIAITCDDFKYIPSIINNPDNITTSGKTKQGKPVLIFEKNIDGNNVVVTYVSDKHKNLELQTMYKFRNDKKNSLVTATNEINSLDITPKANSDTAVDTVDNVSTTNNIMPQSEKKTKIF